MGEPETPPRRTRCRTGCLRCRVRRRKCDEAKPRCQNCIDKGFQCQYGSQLTFLTKNVITVSTPEVPRAYSNIKFVPEDPQNILNEGSSWEDEDSLTPTDVPGLVESRSEPIPHSAVGAVGAVTTILQHNEHISHDDPSFAHWADCEAESPSLDLNPRLSFYSPQDQSTNLSYHRHDDHLQDDTFPVPAGRLHSEAEAISPVIVSDKDEFAARGLLALISREDVAPVLGERLGIDPHRGRTASDATPLTSFDNASYDIAITRPATTQKTTELLRHYRYEVAPWLDLCDMYQSFGIAAFQYAIDSERILRALLLLSEASLHNNNLDRRSSAPLSDSSLPLNMFFSDKGYNENEADEYSFMTTALTMAFRRVHSFVSGLSHAWSMNKVPINMDLLNSLMVDIATSKPTSAIYWLFLRLELSTALANDDTIRFPLPLSLPWEPVDIFPETMDSLAGLTWRLSNFAHRPLIMLGQAMQLLSKDGGEEGPSLPGSSRVDSWKYLINELERWRKERPEEFRPIMELPPSSVEPDSSFPTILFTNGAGIFGNQLYHTAMLMLLLDKPRTVRLTYLPPFVLSPLWHAQCICSISLNNDRRECWDPCLLASFLVAAKRMTHEFQQQDILHGLNRIQTLTGWDIREYVAELQEKWGLLNAV
ncbi:hypothetical protein EYB26_006489 [Talaromyces marneffei]|uniref:uncharacterized protein n=1 Tax=Talaromyces marneffei TaxID=37727 RepID=UPI0012AA575F|nr:uncharacterized protein EYB26_006489 [Talaromyces marneffei]QGA18804.1 hypothetical protein EYB26_006489 [Talaromyces marneffei]